MTTTRKRVPLEDTQCRTWFERDRAHVELRHRGRTLVEWWDAEVHEAVMDGFLDPHDWHGSAWAYARYIGEC